MKQASPEGSWIGMESGCPVRHLPGQRWEMRLGREVGARLWRAERCVAESGVIRKAVGL